MPRPTRAAHQPISAVSKHNKRWRGAKTRAWQVNNAQRTQRTILGRQSLEFAPLSFVRPTLVWILSLLIFLPLLFCILRIIFCWPDKNPSTATIQSFSLSHTTGASGTPRGVGVTLQQITVDDSR